MIDRKHLFKVARVVRSCAEELVKTNQGKNWVNQTHLGGGCGDVSFALAQLTGLSNCLESGTYDYMGHCWLRLPNGEIWDLTATQFSVPARIYITKTDTKYTTSSRGKQAIAGLKLWADENWRRQLRALARIELRKQGL